MILPTPNKRKNLIRIRTRKEVIVIVDCRYCYKKEKQRHYIALSVSLEPSILLLSIAI